MQTDKHQFYFSGYSDDVVLAGHDKASFDEHYSTYFLLSNGLVIKAHHGKNGWEIAPTTPANNASIIPAVDVDDDGTEHTDERIPKWFKAPGYAPVLIIESEEPLEIVAQADSCNTFSDTSPEFIKAAKLRRAVIKAAEENEPRFDEDEMPSVEAFKIALESLKL
jgi:hypothetical protein